MWSIEENPPALILTGLDSLTSRLCRNCAVTPVHRNALIRKRPLIEGPFSLFLCCFVSFCASQSPICLGLKNLWDNSLAGSSPAPGIWLPLA